METPDGLNGVLNGRKKKKIRQLAGEDFGFMASRAEIADCRLQMPGYTAHYSPEKVTLRMWYTTPILWYTTNYHNGFLGSTLVQLIQYAG